ncbi:MAG: sugar-binding transcriptional regulator [Propionicimonas sp.]
MRMPASSVDSHQRLMIRVARMYHEHGIKQPQIAQQLHVSQAKVSRLLKRAEELGIVRVTIEVPPGGFTDLEEALIGRYGLADAVVAEASSSAEADVITAIGAAAAAYLDDVLLSQERIGISSWSATLLAMVSRMTPRARPVAESVTQVLGGVGIPRAQVQATQLTEELARITGGTPQFLTAPGLVSSAALSSAILAEPYVVPVVKEWSRLTVLLAGIGSLEPSPLLRESGNAIPLEEQDLLRGLGAVGDVCLTFFDAEGAEVTSDIGTRVVGIPPAVLRTVPRRVGVAGGERKHGAIRSALLGGWVNVLVTDTETAHALLS